MSGFCLVLSIVGGAMINNESSILIIWLMLLVAIVVGAGVGYLAMTLPKYGNDKSKLYRFFFSWSLVRNNISVFTA